MLCDVLAIRRCTFGCIIGSRHAGGALHPLQPPAPLTLDEHLLCDGSATVGFGFCQSASAGGVV